MADVLPFPDREIKDWMAVEKLFGAALLDIGHSREAIAYAFARFRPVYDELRTQGFGLTFPQEEVEAVNEVQRRANKWLNQVVMVALVGFAELHDALQPGDA